MKCRSRIRHGYAVMFAFLLVPSVLHGLTYASEVPVAENGPALIGGQGSATEDPLQQVPQGSSPTWQRPSPSNPGHLGQPRSFSAPEDGSAYYYERTLTNPQGDMTKTWERTATEEGAEWSRQHLWAGPDGEVIRQHQWSGSQTDPYNYQRQKTMTLPGGRTMTHTQSRTWDGESGVMQRTFQGPNGQYREHSHAWAPEDANPTSPVDPGATMPMEPPGEAEAFAGYPTGSSAQTEQPETGLFGKLKAWGKRTFGSREPGGKSMRRSGFSVGSASRSQASTRASRGAVPKQNPGQAVSSLNRQNVLQHSNSAASRAAGSRPGKSH